MTAKRLTKFLAVMALLIATVLPAAAQEPFKRNLEQVGFVPKGAWIAGVSVSYQQSRSEEPVVPDLGVRVLSRPYGTEGFGRRMPATTFR